MRSYHEGKPVYLEHTHNGHFKFYDMLPLNDRNAWVAVWGKIGTNGQAKIYPASDWYKKLEEKLDKGYQEVSYSGGDYDYKNVTENI